MNVFKSFMAVVNKYAIISALAALGMGVLLILASAQMFQLICTIFGLLLIIPALMWIYEGVVKGGGALFIVPGVIVTLLGAFVIFRYETLANIFGIFFGVFLLIAGLVHVGRALLDKQAGDNGWLLSLILGVGVCAFGVVCIIKRSDAATGLMKVYGVSFLIYAVATLMTVWEFNKTATAVAEEITNPPIEATGATVDADGNTEAANGFADAPADSATQTVNTADSVVEVDGRVIEVINDDEA